MITEQALQSLESQHAKGITSAALLEIFRKHGVRFGEATLRKWVQLGLLPRSVRVANGKGKHRGSKGKYPIVVLRRVLHVKELMRQGWTIDEIQRHFLFMRGDIDALEATLDKIFVSLDQIVDGHDNDTLVRRVEIDLTSARDLASQLVEGLEQIEGRLVSDARARGPEAVAS